jgi:hypothetical protein
LRYALRAGHIDRVERAGRYRQIRVGLAKIACAPSGAPFAGPQELVTFLVRPLDAVVNRLRFHPKISLL